MNSDNMIINNQDEINILFRKYLGIELTDSNYKIGSYDCNDSDIYFTYFAQSYYITYNPESNIYSLYHKSAMGFDAKKHRFHKEWAMNADGADRLEHLIHKISTRHNPKDILNKSKLNPLGIIY